MRVMMRRAALPALVFVVLAACGGVDRPTLDTWLSRWDAIRTTVATATASPGTPPEATCEQVLGELREAAVTLKPTPDPVLDDTITLWLESAESTFFECQQPSGDLDPFGDGLAELERLEAEIAAVVEIDTP